VELTHNLGLATIGNQLYISAEQPVRPAGIMNGLQVQQVAQLLDNLEPWLRETAND